MSSVSGVLGFNDGAHLSLPSYETNTTHMFTDHVFNSPAREIDQETRLFGPAALDLDWTAGELEPLPHPSLTLSSHCSPALHAEPPPPPPPSCLLSTVTDSRDNENVSTCTPPHDMNVDSVIGDGGCSDVFEGIAACTREELLCAFEMKMRSPRDAWDPFINSASVESCNDTASYLQQQQQHSCPSSPWRRVAGGTRARASCRRRPQSAHPSSCPVSPTSVAIRGGVIRQKNCGTSGGGLGTRSTSLVPAGRSLLKPSVLTAINRQKAAVAAASAAGRSLLLKRPKSNCEKTIAARRKRAPSGSGRNRGGLSPETKHRRISASTHQQRQNINQRGRSGELATRAGIKKEAAFSAVDNHKTTGNDRREPEPELLVSSVKKERDVDENVKSQQSGIRPWAFVALDVKQDREETIVEDSSEYVNQPVDVSVSSSHVSQMRPISVKVDSVFDNNATICTPDHSAGLLMVSTEDTTSAHEYHVPIPVETEVKIVGFNADSPVSTAPQSSASVSEGNTAATTTGDNLLDNDGGGNHEVSSPAPNTSASSSLSELLHLLDRRLQRTSNPAARALIAHECRRLRERLQQVRRRARQINRRVTRRVRQTGASEDGKKQNGADSHSPPTDQAFAVLDVCSDDVIGPERPSTSQQSGLSSDLVMVDHSYSSTSSESQSAAPSKSATCPSKPATCPSKTEPPPAVDLTAAASAAVVPADVAADTAKQQEAAATTSSASTQQPVKKKISLSEYKSRVRPAGALALASVEPRPAVEAQRYGGAGQFLLSQASCDGGSLALFEPPAPAEDRSALLEAIMCGSPTHNTADDVQLVDMLVSSPTSTDDCDKTGSNQIEQEQKQHVSVPACSTSGQAGQISVAGSCSSTTLTTTSASHHTHAATRSRRCGAADLPFMWSSASSVRSCASDVSPGATSLLSGPDSGASWAGGGGGSLSSGSPHMAPASPASGPAVSGDESFSLTRSRDRSRDHLSSDDQEREHGARFPRHHRKRDLHHHKHHHHRDVERHWRKQDEEDAIQRRVIYVNGLPEDISRGQLREMFREYGAISCIKIKERSVSTALYGDKMSRCYAFVTFLAQRAALNAQHYGSIKYSHLEVRFGGRREFCLDYYDDKDKTNDYERTPPQHIDFDTLLQLEISRVHQQQQQRSDTIHL